MDRDPSGFQRLEPQKTCRFRSVFGLESLESHERFRRGIAAAWLCWQRLCHAAPMPGFAGSSPSNQRSDKWGVDRFEGRINRCDDEGVMTLSRCDDFE